MSLSLILSTKVRDKLALKHHVTEDEIIQCFANRAGRFLYDTREEHRTTPPTRWFISETDFGRRLKVVFIQQSDGIEIKTAYEPNETEVRIYQPYWSVDTR